MLPLSPGFVLFKLSLASSLPSFFFFNDTATTEIYTLSLHDALPIWHRRLLWILRQHRRRATVVPHRFLRSEEHTSELQSRQYLVCRLLLEKKKIRNQPRTSLIT